MATLMTRLLPTPRPSLFLVLAATIVASAMLFPLAYLIIRTAGVGDGTRDLLLHSRTIRVFVNSALLALAVTIASTFIAVPLAFLTERTDLPGRRFWSVGTALPLVIPSYVGSFVIIAALGPKGSILQNWLEPLGIQRLPSIYGWPGALLSLTLFSYPYILLTVRASLHALDPALEESSRCLGHNRWQTFLRVTLPLLKPSIAAGGLLVALYTLSDFGTPSLMRFDSFTRVIHVQYQSSFDRSMAAVLSLSLVGLAGILLLFENLARSRGRYYSLGTGSRRPPETVELGRWRWPALLFCFLITGLGLVMPLGVIAYWLVRGLSAGEQLAPVWQLAANSVYVSGLSALVATLAALPVAFLSVRFPGLLSAILERSTYIGFALPGIVVALSLVFFGVKYTPSLYQSMAMLIFAYVVLFIPQAVGTIRSSLLQVSPHLEEAAQSLGATHWHAMGTVTMPLVSPGLLTGASLVFLTTMKELPATLLLAPTGFSTLATRVWSATDDAYFARAATPALLLIGVSALSMMIILSQEKRGDGHG
ncbi:MAG: iron ABC transporter permease [Methanopyri archaeon]|nr:iron ABC transporter permease [Methanopyri archaeon]